MELRFSTASIRASLRCACAATSCACAISAAARTSAPACRSRTSSRCCTARFCGIDPARPDWPDSDRFILSKGHAGACIYAALAERGFFPTATLDASLSQRIEACRGMSAHKGVPGVEVSTGSLGHGLGVGAGMAFQLRRLGGKQRVFVVLERRRMRRRLGVGSGAVRRAPPLGRICAPSSITTSCRPRAGRRHDRARAVRRQVARRSAGGSCTSTATTMTRCAPHSRRPARESTRRPASSPTPSRAAASRSWRTRCCGIIARHAARNMTPRCASWATSGTDDA